MKTWTCKQCDRTFDSILEFVHECTYNFTEADVNPTNYECSKCEQTFNTLTQRHCHYLETHWTSDHTNA